MENKKELTLTDFMYKTVRRTGEIAELIFDNYNNDPTKPIRLMGFKTESWKDDYSVREEGYLYYLDLIDESERLRQRRRNDGHKG